MTVWAESCPDTRKRWHGDRGEEPRLGKGTEEGSGLSHIARPRSEKLLSQQWGNSPAVLLTDVDGKEM